MIDNKDVNNDLNDLDDASSNLITLIDDDGTEHEFEILDSAEYNGKEYVAVIPLSECDEESDELIILKVAQSDGEQFLESIDDEKEFDDVGNFFVERLKEEFDFE